MTEKTRGRRFQSGLMEEAATLDQDILNEVILPTLVVQRTINGTADENEVSNQSQIFITSAGYKNTFAYEKLLQFLCESVVRPNESIVLGDTYRIPVLEKLQPKDFITQLKLDGTFNEASFDREFESRWSGSVDGAFFSMEKFNKYRVIEKPEYEPNGRNNEKSYYLLGVDVGRINCTTEVMVIKVSPAPTGVPLKQIVNLYSFDEEHFRAQAIKIKQLFKQYHCKVAMIDGNGLGIGLVDELVMNHEDPDTGETLFGLGVYNDDDGKYKKFETSDTIKNAMYIVKANINLNTELYAYTQAQMGSGKLRFLIDEDKAKMKLMTYTKSQKMSTNARGEYLRPYVMTSILEEQMLNLIQENEGTNIILKQSSKTIKKDKFSALIYGLYWTMMEERNKKSKKFDVNKMMLFN